MMNEHPVPMEQKKQRYFEEHFSLAKKFLEEESYLKMSVEEVLEQWFQDELKWQSSQEYEERRFDDLTLYQISLLGGVQ